MKFLGMKVDLKDLIYIVVLLVGCGITYGSLATKVSALEDRARQESNTPSEVSELRGKLEGVDKRLSDIQSDLRDIKNYLFKSAAEHPHASLQPQGPQSLLHGYAVDRPENCLEQSGGLPCLKITGL